MEARIIIGIIALVGVSGCGLISTLVSNQIVDKVNDKLPETEQFEALGWHLVKRQRPALEHPGAAALAGDALHGGTLRPIE